MTIKRASARAKGTAGEMEILGRLSNILREEYMRRGWPIPEGGLLQRGPNGKDIVGLAWLAPEVKRHERFEDSAIEGWWEQCKSQATNGAVAVLFWRQNRQPWSVRMLGRLTLSNGGAVRTAVDIDLDAFLLWFTHEARARFDSMAPKADSNQVPMKAVN